jgi:hypothetical protein
VEVAVAVRAAVGAEVAVAPEVWVEAAEVEAAEAAGVAVEERGQDRAQEPEQPMRLPPGQWGLPEPERARASRQALPLRIHYE